MHHKLAFFQWKAHLTNLFDLVKELEHTVLNYYSSKQIMNDSRPQYSVPVEGFGVIAYKGEYTHSVNHSFSDIIIDDSGGAGAWPESTASKGKDEKKGVAEKIVCQFCHQPLKAKFSRHVKRTISSRRRGEESIYPCLCNARAHRNCVVDHIKKTRTLQCDACRSPYALSGVYRTFSRKRFSKIIRSLLVTAVLIGVIAIIVSVINRSIMEIPDDYQIVILCFVYFLVFLMMLGFVVYLWRTFCKKDLVDFTVWCKQKEVDTHTSSTRSAEIFQEYLTVNQLLNKKPLEITNSRRSIDKTSEKEIGRHGKLFSGSLALNDNYEAAIEQQEHDIERKFIKNVYNSSTMPKGFQESSEVPTPAKKSKPTDGLRASVPESCAVGPSSLVSMSQAMV